MFQLSYEKPLNCLNPKVDVLLVIKWSSVENVIVLFHLKSIWVTPMKLFQVRQVEQLFKTTGSHITQMCEYINNRLSCCKFYVVYANRSFKRNTQ